MKSLEWLDLYAGKPFEGGGGDIIVIPHPDNGGIGWNPLRIGL